MSAKILFLLNDKVTNINIYILSWPFVYRIALTEKKIMIQFARVCKWRILRGGLKIKVFLILITSKNARL
jgi:hypothetical protein